jgi:hypothetical protein
MKRMIAAALLTAAASMTAVPVAQAQYNGPPPGAPHHGQGARPVPGARPGPGLRPGPGMAPGRVGAVPQRHRRGGGIGTAGAAALGVLGGLAVGGAIASQARPAPPVAYPVEPVDDGGCRIVRRRFIDENGDRVWVNREVCD